MAFRNLFNRMRQEKPPPVPLEGFEQVPETGFDKSFIRLLIFRDCDRRGRSLLFDSKAIRKVSCRPKVSEKSKLSQNFSSSLGGQAPFSMRRNNKVFRKVNHDASSEDKYEFLRPGSDVKMLGEMMFGCVEMAYKGCTMKVHTLRGPSQVMISKVFPCVKHMKESGDFEDSCSYHGSVHSSNEYISTSSGPRSQDLPTVARSVPMDMPDPNSDSDYDSGIPTSASSNSLASLFPSPSSCSSSSFNSSSYNSLHRRWLRNQATSMEFGVRKANRHEEPLSPCDEAGMNGPAQSRAKLAAAIVISTDGQKSEAMNKHFEEFFFSHMPLLEGYMNKLKIAVEKAYNNKQNFIHLIDEAHRNIQSSIYDLYVTPRLSQPAWLTLVTRTDNYYQVTDKFISTLMDLAVKVDIKANNFFLTTLLTAVLTHHLAWVPTVIPAGASPSQVFMDKHTAKWLDMLAKSHPYNPLWAQLGDLYGAIGYPCKVSRTIITGKNKDTILQLLYVLSYFLRCSEVCENVETKCEEDTTSEFDNTASDRGRHWSTGSKGTLFKSVKILKNITGSLECLSSKAKSLSPDASTPKCQDLPKVPQSIVTEASSKEKSEAQLDSGHFSIECASPDKERKFVAEKENVEVEKFQCRLAEEQAKSVQVENAQHVRQSAATPNAQVCTTIEGSSSMFDEYFSDGSQVKTIDKIPSKKTGLIEVTSQKDGAMDGRNINGLSLNLTQACDYEDNKMDSGIWMKPPMSAGFPYNTDILSAAEHVMLPKSIVTLDTSCNQSFGWSLMAGYSDHYVSDFILQGTNDKKLMPKVLADLSITAQDSVLDEPIAEAVCLIADTDNWSVKLCSSQWTATGKPYQLLSMSQMVANMLEKIRDLYAFKIPPEFCVMHIEDQLQELYFQSKTLVEYLRSQKCIKMSELSTVLGFDESDLALLLAVASTHSPHITFGL